MSCGHPPMLWTRLTDPSSLDDPRYVAELNFGGERAYEPSPG